MKVTAIIQARMGSTRLPGKVLMDLGGETVLGRVVARLRRASKLQEIVVATSSNVNDDCVAEECRRMGVPCFRGDEDDVLGRYLGAAEQFGCKVMVRITADCPLIDPAIVDEVVVAFLERQPDLACNDRPPTFPRGLDVEVFPLGSLRKANEMALEKYQREHVTPVFYERGDIFRVASARAERDYSRYRWTLDTPEDLQLIREVYSNFGNNDDFSWREVLELMERKPELA